MKFRAFIGIIAVIFSVAALAGTSPLGDREIPRAELEGWLAHQELASTRLFLANVSRPGTLPGAVVASPGKENPEYFYHWVRDAALVMDAVQTLYERAENHRERASYRQRMFDYAGFVRKLQLVPNQSGGLGEPKFTVHATAYDKPWGRPQNDGPALRALVLMRFARQLLREGEVAYVRGHLYDGRIPTHSVIKADLEYVSHHWRDTNFDLWEEVRGDHFYTRVVQRKALLQGAAFAEEMGDGGAAAWYRDQAERLRHEIAKHWDEAKGIFVVTRHQTGGRTDKHSGLDSSIVLAVLHGADDPALTVADSRLLSTMVRLEQTFSEIYKINSFGPSAPAIGRYPEDRYNGYHSDAWGNPWVLLTNAFAEHHFRLARQIDREKRVAIDARALPFYRRLVPELGGPVTVSRGTPEFDRIVRALRARGDQFLERVRYHAFQDGGLSEQMNRDTGYMQGAENLTWSHVSFLTARWNR